SSGACAGGVTAHGAAEGNCAGGAGRGGESGGPTMSLPWPRRLEPANARHPRRTILAWTAAVLVAIVVIGTLLSGALTTEGKPTNNPQSERAKNVREAAFPAASSAGITDIIVVHSPSSTVDTTSFRISVQKLTAEVRRAEGVESVRSYLDAQDPSLVSSDRHATMVQFAMPDESSSGIDDVISDVQRGDANAEFEVTVTGQRT